MKLLKIYDMSKMKVHFYIVKDIKYQEIGNTEPEQYFVVYNKIYKFLEKIEKDKAIGVR